jgi:hypothetical protein
MAKPYSQVLSQVGLGKSVGSPGSCKLEAFEGKGKAGTIEMKIWAEFVGIDGVLARRELIVIRRDVEQTFPNLSKPTKS